MARRPLHAHFLGRMPYVEALELQRELATLRKAHRIEDTVLFLEHDPVITVGRDGSWANILVARETLASRSVEVAETDRGGDVTFHGPGQVIAYLIIDLRPDCKDVRRYVNRVEAAMIDVLEGYGLFAGRKNNAPGVWMENPDRKLGAIGARMSRWVTHHGLALNVNTDLSYFDLIVPCGIADKGVSSLHTELGHRVSIIEVMERLASALASRFDRTLVMRGGESPFPVADEGTHP